MSNKTRKVLSWGLIILVALISLFNLPLQQIKNSTSTFINDIHDFISDINNVFTINDDSSSDHHIKTISFSTDNNKHYAVIEFNTIKAKDVLSIKINDTTLTDITFFESKNAISVNITSVVLDDESTPIKVSTIKTIGGEHLSSLKTTFYKEIDYDIILEKQKSLVGISATKVSFPREISSSWGSGVIFSKKKIIKNPFFGRPYEAYEYLILTNYHVVENGDSFDIHYGEYGNNLSNFSGTNVQLMGVYTKNTDLAILKLTTRDASLVALDDEQFTNKTPVPVEKDQIVFGIGSPYVNDKVMFNSYKIGKVEDPEIILGQLQDSDLCKYGCYSIQTNAYQGEGSSGGGVFDFHGNLIGLHFAGNSDYQQSFEIPMEVIFEAIDEILGDYQLSASVYQTKRSPQTSFLFDFIA